MSLSWSLGGVAGAALGLIALEAIVSNPGGGANGGVPGLLALPGQWAAGWMDPTKPLISGPAGFVAAATSGFGAAGLSAATALANSPPPQPQTAGQGNAGGGRKTRG